MEASDSWKICFHDWKHLLLTNFFLNLRTNLSSSAAAYCASLLNSLNDLFLKKRINFMVFLLSMSAWKDFFINFLEWESCELRSIVLICSELRRCDYRFYLRNCVNSLKISLFLNFIRLLLDFYALMIALHSLKISLFLMFCSFCSMLSCLFLFFYLFFWLYCNIRIALTFRRFVIFYIF